jgi:CRISPR/Cas system-associated endoribonuclease Cas2
VFEKKLKNEIFSQMSSPANFALMLQQSIFNVDAATMKTAKLLMEKDKVIDEHKLRIEKLERQLDILSKKNEVC